jgi:TonB-dependent SusC/RagA subfamily outer membrane receptor
MNKIANFFFALMLPFGVFAQFNISGKILNQADTKPIANVSVFLNNATIGDKTANDGTFTLHNVHTGKYELIVSIIGFETYTQSITVSNDLIKLPDIRIFPKTILLSEVNIKYHEDANREKYYRWFENEFLGTSKVADECKIINPEVLNLNYDKKTHILTTSSSDFLIIENQALGYKIKYLVTNFSLDDDPHAKFRLNYEGSVLFEEMKGTSTQEIQWQQKRQEVYQGSVVHFLRSALYNRINPEGFRVYRIMRYPNPNRPQDSLIDAKIKFYKGPGSEVRGSSDSLLFWTKKSALQKILEKISPVPLTPDNFISLANQQDLFKFGLGSNKDPLYITYSKNHRFDSHLNKYKAYLDDPDNKENTRVDFDEPYAFFDRNGAIVNPGSLIFSGAWSKTRVADLLPIDYEAPKNPAPPFENKITKNITGKLDTFLTNHITEKVYLQFDKPYYAAGDTIYFKAYVTESERHQLSNTSEVLHADLINTNTKIDQSIKLHLDSGVAWGDFALPDSLPKGDYRVRAYTQWMRNDSQNSYFNQTIAVGSVVNNKILESGTTRVTAVNPKPDIQFLPEGGSLVTGVRSKVAFKAIGASGLEINVKGVVVDNENKEVCAFSSAHLGMGYFFLNPSEGKTYKAKLTFSDGTQDIVDLPKPEVSGIVLSINNDSIPKASVKIEANAAYFQANRNKELFLLIYSGGIATTVTCKLDSSVISFDILKRRLHTGVATVTLFSASGEPLCERLLFIQNYDQLSLNINSDKTSYAKKEKVNISLNAKNRADSAVTGHFSVSVIDESKVPSDENKESTILTNLLLTSDLKGYVEQPNYYFTDTSTIARLNLDVLMLTQGYRRFEWKQVLDNNNPPLAYQPEKGLEISGMVTNLFGKPIANGTVTLLPSKGGPLLSSVSNDKGIFHFSKLIFTDTTRFVLSAVNAKGQNSTKITYFNDKPEPVIPSNRQQDIKPVTDTTMAVYLDNAKKERNEFINYGRGRGIVLKEVKIREKKRDDQYRSSSLAGPGHADQVMHADEIEQIGGQLSTSLEGRLHGVGFSGGVPYLRAPPGSGRMLVIVDGTEMVGPIPFDINQIPSSQIETIEVLRFASASIYGMRGGSGVLIITTKQGGGTAYKDIASIGILPIAPIGFYKAREFYSPKYDNANLNSKQKDFRSTIYWKPELITNKDGNASFDYYNADGTGTYKVIIEGIDNKGNLGRQVFRYKVE